MNTATRAPEPTFATALRQQLRLLWVSRRPIFFAAILVGTLAMMRLILVWAGDGTVLLFGRLTNLVVFVSAAWALIVWRDDPPKNRRYHWSMPVDMAHHDLARVLAGAIWLLPALAAFFVAGSLLALGEGQAAELGRAAPMLALRLLIAPLLGYLLLAPIGVASNRPLEWVIGLFIGIQGLIGAGTLLDRSGTLLRIFEAVFGPPWGLGWALAAPFSADGPGGGAGSAIDVLAGWLPAVLLWLVITSAMVTLAAVRRRGRA